jgi:hypothetical protein
MSIVLICVLALSLYSVLMAGGIPWAALGPGLHSPARQPDTALTQSVEATAP